jgi:hypothetical protein
VCTQLLLLLLLWSVCATGSSSSTTAVVAAAAVITCTSNKTAGVCPCLRPDRYDATLMHQMCTEAENGQSSRLLYIALTLFETQCAETIIS